MTTQDKELLASPPKYELVDIVQEFTCRFQRRNDDIHELFNERRHVLKLQYEQVLQDLAKEEMLAVGELHAIYTNWIRVEPEHDIFATNKTALSSSSLSYWAWVRSLFLGL
jgi:hypothetical protein